MFRKLYRGIRLGWILSLFLVRTAFIRKFNKDESRRNKKLAVVTHKTAKSILRLFKVTVQTLGSGELENPKVCLILSNHLSYVDIIIISAVRPSLFLSHKGIQQEPLVGWLAEGGGTLFVDRSTRSKLQDETARLAGLLQDGNTMTLFPEGTTGNGDGIMPFHAAFITAAIKAGVDVLPVCVQYKKLNGVPVTRRNRQNIYIYDKMPFLPHINNLYKTLINAEVTVTAGERIHTEGRDRKSISEEARNWMINIYEPVED